MHWTLQLSNWMENDSFIKYIIFRLKLFFWSATFLLWQRTKKKKKINHSTVQHIFFFRSWKSMTVTALNWAALTSRSTAQTCKCSVILQLLHYAGVTVVGRLYSCAPIFNIHVSDGGYCRGCNEVGLELTITLSINLCVHKMSKEKCHHNLNYLLSLTNRERCKDILLTII